MPGSQFTKSLMGPASIDKMGLSRVCEFIECLKPTARATAILVTNYVTVDYFDFA
jgi:hypothetical protein